MKNVYFVQVDISAGLETLRAYLPYTAGAIAANTWESEIVKKTYVLKELIFLREDINSVVSRLDNPAVVVFSCYSWNTEYNKALAIAVKENYPDCIIVFGGHNVPANCSFLEQYPYIDYLSHGEGEQTVRLLFEALAQGNDLYSVPDISFRDNGKPVQTKPSCYTSVESYPSPYLKGYFDEIIRQHPDIIFNAILDTTRGCPNHCAYCDWGSLESKIRMFPLEKIKAEIKWMSDHKIGFVWGADGNFGLFSRDLEIANTLVEAKETTGYPERVRINYAKNRPDNVFTIVKKFKECELDRLGATLSFQSMSPEVLENIGRSNDDISFYKDLITKYNKENMQSYSELILALPGETYESFIKGLGMLFEIGLHFVFEVYGCILLPNSPMGQKDYMEKYGIKTIRTELMRAHYGSSELVIPEYYDFVVETNTMDRDAVIRAMVFTNVVKAFHGNGLLRAFAIYLFCEMSIPYETFYDGMLTYFEANPTLFVSKLYLELKEYVREQYSGVPTRKLIFEPCGDFLWDGYEYLVLHILNNLELFFSEMLPYINRFNIPKEILTDLLSYQKAVLRKPNEEQTVINQNYDINSFLSNIYINNYHPLEKKRHKLSLKDSKPQFNWIDFGKYVVWYGKMGWASYKDDITEL